MKSKFGIFGQAIEGSQYIVKPVLNHHSIQPSQYQNDQPGKKIDITKNEIIPDLIATDSRCSLMIKNVPNSISLNELLDILDQNYEGLYDYVYLPIDFEVVLFNKNKCNLGYAFVNLLNQRVVASFVQSFEGKPWNKKGSSKVLSWLIRSATCAMLVAKAATRCSSSSVEEEFSR